MHAGPAQPPPRAPHEAAAAGGGGGATDAPPPSERTVLFTTFRVDARAETDYDVDEQFTPFHVVADPRYTSVAWSTRHWASRGVTFRTGAVVRPCRRTKLP